MAHEDERPILVCRVECPASFQGPLDEWMPKHFDDSLANPGVTSAHNFGVSRDWEQLPSLFNDDGTRFIVYVADTRASLLDWVDGPELREAIDDGVEREAQYPPLDDEPFNGTIYELMAVRRPVGSDIVGRGPMLAERFDVPPERMPEFDAWLNGPHLDAVEAFPGIARVRTFSQLKDDVPHRFPFDRYIGKGNRMIWAELGERTDLVSLLSDDGVLAALRDSQQWDLRLPYVRREVAVHLLTRWSGDAEREAAAAAAG
jgi:hypothetical protein